TQGVCGGGHARSCPSDLCNDGFCDEFAQMCVLQPTNEGGSCNDGMSCTSGEVCVSGVCSATACAPGADCNAIACPLNCQCDVMCADAKTCNTTCAAGS